jgi:hypothetical protein
VTSPVSPSQRRRRAAWLFAAIVLLLVAVAIWNTFDKSRAPFPQPGSTQIKPGGLPAVVQMRPPNVAARATTEPACFALGDEVLVDVRSPGTWLRQRLSELGKGDLNPGSKVTLGSVTYDQLTEPVEYRTHLQLRAEEAAIREEQARIKKLSPADPATLAAAQALVARQKDLESRGDDLLRDRRNSAWLEAVKTWLEKSSLMLDGRVFTDLHPQIGQAWLEHYTDKNGDPDFDRYYGLRFRLNLSAMNRDQWRELFGGIGLGAKPVSASIAFVGVFEPGRTEILPTELIPTTSSHWQKIFLQPSGDCVTWGLLFAFGALLLIFIYYALVSNLLREFCVRDGLWHLSLGRCQMAFWFFIVCGCYIFLWIVTGDYKTLTSQELLLLGISAGTGLGALLIADRSDEGSQRPRGSEDLRPGEMDIDDPRELQALIDAELSQKKTAGGISAKSQNRIEELQRRADYYRRGFLRCIRRAVNDLVDEANDGKPSFHRFQMIGWTLVLGAVFLRAVYYKLAMPEFSADQLLLMGISNGTYLGFKWSVKKEPTRGR